jgi:hypothetical protein
MVHGGLRQLPVGDGTGWIGIVDIADVCGALLGPRPGERPATSQSSRSAIRSLRRKLNLVRNLAHRRLPRPGYQASRPDRYSQPIWSAILPRVCRAATRASASRAWSSGTTVSACGREFAGIDKGSQLLKPRPAAVGSE